ncbi:bacillithiol biosynthesis cysteine-adding enzyme BshC [Tenacibaculum sp. UWU-22]|uniref:bacillithiol biosynthesis cysteine-adding enzyme BshC n=1 Tax=Tenacibaculum sp. UWU-22 TaxID=3234187 RepID=UPI0034DB112F
MNVSHIPFYKTGFFSKIIADYLSEKETIRFFYHNYPNFNGFKKQIEEKQASFLNEKRQVLVRAIQNQYAAINASNKTQKNIEALLQENTFTVTTGHQLNLFTGPLYFLYKIISTINLCEELTQKFPKKNFVPVYWMATEDHDFAEINYFNFKGIKVQWNTNQKGAVGRFSTDGLALVLERFSEELGDSEHAEFLKNLFYQAYVTHSKLADATRYIANELFGAYGLVVLDSDSSELKQQFTPYVKDELLANTSFKAVSNTNDSLKENYAIQVNPREINLFYLKNNLRERIVVENQEYKVHNTAITFTKDEILEEVERFPDRFSPNVIMRPLYQEVILPNLCYIGGGGELAYWLQLKKYFNTVAVPFPILLLRNSVQIISQKQQKKLDKLHISIPQLFLKQNDLVVKKVKENTKISFDFTQQKTFLQEQFLQLKNIAKQTDVTFLGAVNAQEQKQLKGLENLEKRLIKAEKRKQKDLVERIKLLQNELLPNQSLEERQRNFSEYYLAYGDMFLKTLKNTLKPLQLEFTVVVFEN